MHCLLFILFGECFFSIKELKQSQLSKHAKSLEDIEDERLKLQEDRARMEVEKKLHSKSFESGISRAEIDASVKYAEVNKILLLLCSKKGEGKTAFLM